MSPVRFGWDRSAGPDGAVLSFATSRSRGSRTYQGEGGDSDGVTIFFEREVIVLSLGEPMLA